MIKYLTNIRPDIYRHVIENNEIKHCYIKIR